MPDLHKLSELPEEFRNLVNTPDVYATAVFDEGFRACAHTASDGEPAPGSNSDLALQEDEKYHITGEVDDTPAPEYDPSFGAFAHWSLARLNGVSPPHAKTSSRISGFQNHSNLNSGQETPQLPVLSYLSIHPN